MRVGHTPLSMVMNWPGQRQSPALMMRRPKFQGYGNSCSRTYLRVNASRIHHRLDRDFVIGVGGAVTGLRGCLGMAINGDLSRRTHSRANPVKPANKP